MNSATSSNEVPGSRGELFGELQSIYQPIFSRPRAVKLLLPQLRAAGEDGFEPLARVLLAVRIPRRGGHGDCGIGVGIGSAADRCWEGLWLPLAEARGFSRTVGRSMAGLLAGRLGSEQRYNR
jgi:hypothetical protein